MIRLFSNLKLGLVMFDLVVHVFIYGVNAPARTVKLHLQCDGVSDADRYALPIFVRRCLFISKIDFPPDKLPLCAQVAPPPRSL